MENSKTKKILREEAKLYRKNLSEEEILGMSQEIIKHLKQMEAFQTADEILVYVSLPGEVDTRRLIVELLDKGKAGVFCPVTLGDEMEFYGISSFAELKEGNFHVLEPTSEPEKQFIPVPEKKYCIILPGLMFDLSGNRLGYGKGYYDKFLAKLNGNIQMTRIALSYSAMVKEQIPFEETDKPAQFIVTETGVIYCNEIKEE